MVSPEIMRAVEQFTLNVTVPILYDQQERVDHIGTGTLFEIDDRYFLVTARHLFDKHSAEHCAIPYNPIDSKDFHTLGHLELHKAVDTPDTEIDIAVLELLEPATIDAIQQGWRLLKPEHAALPSAQGTFLLCGYPSTRIKVDGERLGGTLMSAYTERMPEAPAEAELPVDERIDLFLRYDKEATDINGKTIQTPELCGVSGSSVWEYRELPPGQLWTAEATLKIVGIQSAAVKHKYARAKSWEFVMAMLRKILATQSSSR